MKPRVRWRNSSPQLVCPDCNHWMGWLGSCYWICYSKHLHAIKVSLDFSGSLWRSEYAKGAGREVMGDIPYELQTPGYRQINSAYQEWCLWLYLKDSGKKKKKRPRKRRAAQKEAGK